MRLFCSFEKNSRGLCWIHIIIVYCLGFNSFVKNVVFPLLYVVEWNVNIAMCLLLTVSFIWLRLLLSFNHNRNIIKESANHNHNIIKEQPTNHNPDGPLVESLSVDSTSYAPTRSREIHCDGKQLRILVEPRLFWVVYLGPWTSFRSSWTDSKPVYFRQNDKIDKIIVQELCESRGGRPGLSVLTSLLDSVDVKIYWTVLRHWSQLVPNMSTDIWGH